MSTVSGTLKKLSIAPCTDEGDGYISVDRAEPFEAMLNPASWAQTGAIRYDTQRTLGQLAPQPEFSSIEGEEVTFDLLLDGTGVVPPARPGRTPSVDDQLARLRAIVYDYDGDDHQPRIVRVLWGSLHFFGRLTSIDVDYTLYGPDGMPLRAKVDLAFVRFVSAKEAALRANRSSPDLSHSVLVREGDTLPLLCHRIYRDCAYYPDVARYNGLSDLRRLEPGTVLRFPPLA